MKARRAALVDAACGFGAANPRHKGSSAFLITSDEEGRAQDGTKRVTQWLAERGEKIDWCVIGEPSGKDRLGDTVRVNVQIIAADDKRIHYFEELRHVEEGWVSATSENMTLHIDMNVRKVAPFPKDIYERVQAVAAAHAKGPQPDGIGRRIEIPKKK